MARSAPEAGRKNGFTILMVAPTSFFNDYGGHIRILEETLALQALGHRVTIVTYHKGNEIAGLDIRRTARLPYHADYEVGSSRHKLAFDAYLLPAAIRVGLGLRPDIVHGHMHEGALIGAAVARLLGAPLVFDFQGGLTAEMVDHDFITPGSRVYRLLRWLERRVCHMPQAILTSSLQAQELLIEQFAVAAPLIHPLPDCVDTTRFHPAVLPAETRRELRRHLGIPDERPVVAYLGLLASYQGTAHLVEAAARLKAAGRDVHFLVMGYPNVQRYRALAEASGVGDRMLFTGRVPYDAAPAYLALGDIAVSPKMSLTEGSGKVLNYMAMALPVVAYDSPVHREYLGELGVFAPSGDVAGLVQAITGLVDDPAIARRLGAQLRQRARDQYSWSRAARDITALYQCLTGDKSESKIPLR
jgi:glycosyltransferase involved in cell wall biosynthesis